MVTGNDRYARNDLLYRVCSGQRPRSKLGRLLFGLLGRHTCWNVYPTLFCRLRQTGDCEGREQLHRIFVLSRELGKSAQLFTCLCIA